MNSLICPNCSTEMNFITFLKAPTPYHLKCNKCNTKLNMKKYRRAFTFIALVYGGILGVFLGVSGGLFFFVSNYENSSYFDKVIYYLLFCGVGLVLGIVFMEILAYSITKKYDFGLEIR